MDSPSGDQTPFSPESEAREWASEWKEIQREAAKFPKRYREDLEAELAKSLVVWKRRPGILNWNAFRRKALHNRALTLIKQWRRRDERTVELIVERDFQPSDVPAPDYPDVNAQSAAQRLWAFQRRLANDDRHLLKQLKECDWNISRLARLRGEHRNTIHRRLRQIQIRCPIEIESAPIKAGPQDLNERTKLVAMIQKPFASARQIRRARVLVALLDGRTYEQIKRTLGVSSSTIVRWRRRHVRRGIVGLKAKHAGKKPSRARLRLEKWLGGVRPAQKPSLRSLASQFRLGKSTIQRILKDRR